MSITGEVIGVVVRAVAFFVILKVMADAGIRWDSDWEFWAVWVSIVVLAVL